jgi:CTP:molybdopterin cytidylyltransferase MocA
VIFFQIAFFCLAVASVAYARPQYFLAGIPPQPVADTPEVAAAKVAHFAAWNAAAVAAAAAPDLDGIPIAAPFISAYAAPGTYFGPLAGVPAIVNGVPADTPEVTAAKIAHFAAHAQARALSG